MTFIRSPTCFDAQAVDEVIVALQIDITFVVGRSYTVWTFRQLHRVKGSAVVNSVDRCSNQAQRNGFDIWKIVKCIGIRSMQGV